MKTAMISILCACWLVTSCCMSAPTPSPFDMLAKSHQPFLDMIPVPPQAATLEDAAQPVVHGMAIVRHARQLANVPGGLPLIVIKNRPVAGIPWRVGFTTRPTDPVNAEVALLVTFTPPPEPAPIPNGRGGMLMVPLKQSIRPAPNSVLTQYRGDIEANITFRPEHVGVEMWAQMIVRDPRSGVTVSPMLHIRVGNR